MNIIRLAFFLASRSIMRSSIWSTALIVAIMMLTFLNLVVVGGILTGLVAGLAAQTRTYYSSDVIIEPAPSRNYISQSASIIRTLQSHPDVQAFSSRYIQNGTIEANYHRSIRSDESTDSATAEIVGIQPYKEDSLASISTLVTQGEFLDPNDRGKIIMGADLMIEYLQDPNSENNTVKGVKVGDKVRLHVGGETMEVIVKGVLHSKLDRISRRIYMTENDLRQIIGRNDLNRSEIAIKVKNTIDPATFQSDLLVRGFGEKNSIKTWQESLGTFFDDVSGTFATLGNFVGSIGLFIASVTVFIIIFVNALNRRKYIGILKAIGIEKMAIELSYVLQSIFYAVTGGSIGLFFLFFLLVPYFQNNPIDFPFSDGILATTVQGSILRALILLIFAIIAAYIPARIIANQNTVDSILDR